jgi:hypothetical protein
MSTVVFVEAVEAQPQNCSWKGGMGRGLWLVILMKISEKFRNDIQGQKKKKNPYLRILI